MINVLVGSFMTNSLSSSDIVQTELTKCLTAQKRARQELIFGSITAWKIHGMALPCIPILTDDHVHAYVNDQRSRSRLAGVRFHTWPHPMPTRTIYGPQESVILVDVFTACMQTLKYCTRDEAVVMFDAMMCRDRRFRVVTREELIELFLSLPRFHGRETGEWGIRHCREGVDSPMETRVRLRLVRSGLPCPVVNFRVVHTDTGEYWFLDLAYPELRVAFEYQGEQYHATREGLRRDSRKLSALQGLGWRVIPITADMLQSEQAWNRLLDTIIDVIHQQSRLLGVRVHLRRH